MAARPIIGWLAAGAVVYGLYHLFFGKSTKSGAGTQRVKQINVPKKLTSTSFEQFGIVEDFSDHYYRNEGTVHQPLKSWTKKIQDEWKILKENLPESIYVRVYESRMDLLRAAIIGADGTPYHDVLFFFDIMFPPSYPQVPPKVHFHSGGLSLNPNLYNNGYVCLSLLGTWTGRNKSELWIPNKSTILQVLVSIQALIFNSNPFFNEPGFDTRFTGKQGRNMSKRYNEHVFVLSLRTITYSLHNPPKCFEELVTSHYRCRALDILFACRMYSKGVEVGSDVVRNIGNQAKKLKNNNSTEFKASLVPVLNRLIEAFIRNGSTACQQFKGTYV